MTVMHDGRAYYAMHYYAYGIITMGEEELL
jgi:hypothetical protein